MAKRKPRLKTPPPDLQIKRYRLKLQALVNVMAAQAIGLVSEKYNDLFDTYTKETGAAADSFASDLKELIAALQVVGEAQKAATLKALAPLAKEIKGYNHQQNNRQAKAVLGVDLFKESTKLTPLTELWVTKNTGLIKDVSDQFRNKVVGIVSDGFKAGKRIEEVRESILSQQVVSKSRAETIARTETAQLNAQITQYRQTQLGIDYFEWSSSKDERVREDHAAMDGLLCRWDDSTVASSDNGKTWVARPGTLANPGEDINCRCQAYPVFNDEVES